MGNYRVRLRYKSEVCHSFSDFLMHYGITGMKWGVRRFQNEDRSLTPAGKERYSSKTKNSDSDEKNKQNEQKSNYKKLKQLQKDIAKDLKNGAERNHENSIFKKGQKLLDQEAIDDLATTLRENEKKSLQGKSVDDTEYYAKRDKIVNDFLGKYKDKKMSGGRSSVSAGWILTRIVSDAASNKVLDEEYSEFLKKYSL